MAHDPSYNPKVSVFDKLDMKLKNNTFFGDIWKYWLFCRMRISNPTWWKTTLLIRSLHFPWQRQQSWKKWIRKGATEQLRVLGGLSAQFFGAFTEWKARGNILLRYYIVPLFLFMGGRCNNKHKCTWVWLLMSSSRILAQLPQNVEEQPDT